MLNTSNDIAKVKHSMLFFTTKITFSTNYVALAKSIFILANVVIISIYTQVISGINRGHNCGYNMFVTFLCVFALSCSIPWNKFNLASCGKKKITSGRLECALSYLCAFASQMQCKCSFGRDAITSRFKWGAINPTKYNT